MASTRRMSLPHIYSRFTIKETMERQNRNFSSAKEIQQVLNERSSLLADTVRSGMRSRISQLFQHRRKSRNSYPQTESERSCSVQESEQDVPQGDSGVQSFVESVSGAICDDSAATMSMNIDDLNINADSHVTMAILRKCNRQIIRPFRSILKVVAWKPLFNTASARLPFIWSFFNVLFSAMIMTFLFISYVYQIILSPLWNPSHHVQNVTNRTNVSSTTRPSEKIDDTGLEISFASPYQHLISVQLIPNFLHLVSYLIGFWHFRVTDSEHVDALMERVFLSFAGCDRGRMNQRRITILLRFHIAFSISWTVLGVLSNILYDHAYIFRTGSVTSLCYRNACAYLIWVTEYAGNFVMYLVIVVIAFNFAVQCEAVIAFLDCLLQKIQERSLELREVTKEINCVKENIKILNGASAAMMSIQIFNLGDLSIMGVRFLFKAAEKPTPMRMAYHVLYILRTIPMALFPIMLTCRVNQFCNRVHHAGIEVRTNGYRNASQLELDSFLLYTTINKFWSRLFGVAFRGFHLTTLFIILLAALVIVVQFGVFEQDIL